MEEDKEDRELEDQEKRIFLIQPHDCRIDVSWKFELINPEENKNKEK